MPEQLRALILKGEQALKNGDTLVALMQFEAALAMEPSPGTKSKLAFCLATERRQFQRAVELCRQALQDEPNNPDHYYQLGRIYLHAGQKPRAIKTLRKGLKFRRHQPIIDELNRLGARRSPLFPSLPREHFLNRNLGLLLARLGAR